MSQAPRRTPPLIWLLTPVVVAALVTSVLGQGADPGVACVPASGDLATYAVKLDRFWGTRTTLLVCEGASIPFGSHATPGKVFFVPQQARSLAFDGLGIVYLISHEWGHQVQFQRLGVQNAFVFSQQREFQADCLAGYFIGASFSYLADTERRLMSFASAIGDDRILHDTRLSGPLGNVIDQYTKPGAHGNGQGRAAFLQTGYRDGRQHGIVSCAVIAPNFR